MGTGDASSVERRASSVERRASSVERRASSVEREPEHFAAANGIASLRAVVGALPARCSLNDVRPIGARLLRLHATGLSWRAIAELVPGRAYVWMRDAARVAEQCAEGAPYAKLRSKAAHLAVATLSPWPDDRRRLAQLAMDQGLTAREVAEIARWRRDRAFPPRPRGRPADPLGVAQRRLGKAVIAVGDAARARAPRGERNRARRILASAEQSLKWARRAVESDPFVDSEVAVTPVATSGPDPPAAAS